MKTHCAVCGVTVLRNEGTCYEGRLVHRDKCLKKAEKIWRQNGACSFL